MIWIPARKREILYCKTGSFIVEVPEWKIKHTIPKQKESYNRYCVFFRYQSMQEKLPVAASFKCMAIKTSASLHSKKAAIHNCLLYSRISYYFSNEIQFHNSNNFIFPVSFSHCSLLSITLSIFSVLSFSVP